MSGAPATTGPPTTENCRFCWMCRHACPVGHVSHRETYTPHAWALTIESVRRRQIVWNEESTSVLYACADCGLCQAHCATDQPLPDAIVSTRMDVVSAGLAPASVHEFDQRLRAGARAHASRPTPHATSDVALFVGEEGGANRSAIDAALRLLERAGVRAVPVGEGRSTGSVAASLGLRATAVACGQALLADVEASGAVEVLVLTPGDRWTFEHVYPARLGLAWPTNVAVREVTTVLAAALASGSLTFKSRGAQAGYAYHDPCHSARIQREDLGPRALLHAALGHPGLKTFWRERRAHPCGATSGLDITHPELAALLADARLADAASAGATMLITEDPSCLRHLESRGRMGIDVVGMYELLAERL